MSLLAKNTGLIILSALLIFSCKEKEKLGLQPHDNTVGVFYSDTLSLTTKAVLKNDSIETHNQSVIYAGAFHDPEFGNISASSFTQLILKDRKDVSSYLAVDSVVMTLSFHIGYAYGDTTEDQTINVYKLNAAIDSAATYYSTSPALSTVSGIVDLDLPFQARPAKGYQKIKLSNTFGAELLNIIGDSISNQEFTNAFKGIALIPKALDKGAVLKIKLYDNTSGIKIHYKKSATVGDTSSVQLLLTTSGDRFSRLVSDRTGVLSSLVNSGDEVDAAAKVYLQSGIGIGTKVQFPTLNSVKDSLGNVAINRAELVIQLDPSTTIPFRPIVGIELIKLNEAGKVQQFLFDGKYYSDVVQEDLFDINGHSNPLAAGYNSISNTYTFNITTYFHAMINGVVPNNGFLISPYPSFNTASVDRVFGESVKMKIYYTKID